MSAFRLGVKAAVPTALGYVAIGLAFGAVAAASGLSALRLLSCVLWSMVAQLSLLCVCLNSCRSWPW